MARDPVCGMAVPEDSGHRLVHEGTIYLFCSDRCLRKFQQEPHQYLRPHDDPSHGHAPHEHRAARGGRYDNVPVGYTGTVYTCPMHPEVRQTEPGACPLCGMGLEPERAAGAEESPNPELIDFTRRLWVGVIFTLPLLVLTMTPYLGITVIREFFGERTAMWIELALGTPVILWAGWPFFVRGYHSFRTMNLNMFSLIGMGVSRRLHLQHRRRAGTGCLPRRFP